MGSRPLNAAEAGSPRVAGSESSTQRSRTCTARPQEQTRGGASLTWMRASSGEAACPPGGPPETSHVAVHCNARQAAVPAGSRAATAVDQILGVQPLAGVLAALSNLPSKEAAAGVVPVHNSAQGQAQGTQTRNP